MTDIAVVRFLKFWQKVQKAQLILLVSFKTENRGCQTQKIIPQFWLVLATVFITSDNIWFFGTNAIASVWVLLKFITDILKLPQASATRDAIAASLVTIKNLKSKKWYNYIHFPSAQVARLALSINISVCRLRASRCDQHYSNNRFSCESNLCYYPWTDIAKLPRGKLALTSPPTEEIFKIC